MDAIAYFRRVRLARDLASSLRGVSRFVKAGSSEDCGHRPKGGLFDSGNTCAAGGGRKDGSTKSRGGSRPMGGGIRGAKGLAVYSPNVLEGTDFAHAARAIRSPEQKQARADLDAIDAKLGLKGRSFNAIGDWSDGAENSIVTMYNGVNSFDQLIKAASAKGLKWNQKGVIPVLFDRHGPDAVHEVDVQDTDLKRIRRRLQESGIEFRSIIPGKSKTRIVVIDFGAGLNKNMKKFGDHYVGKIRGRARRCKAEFIGADTRTQARDAYRERISPGYKRLGEGSARLDVGRYVRRRRRDDDRRRRFAARPKGKESLSGHKVKAGDPDDCGHRRQGGLFDLSNDCAKKTGNTWRANETYLPKEYRGTLSKEEVGAIKSPEAWKAMVRLADEAVRNKSGYLPTVDELKALAKMGQSARGQYEYGGRFLRATFAGHGPAGESIARFWESANAIFSARTGWKVHSNAASLFTKLWLDADMPTGSSPEAVAKMKGIIKYMNAYEKPNGALAFVMGKTKAGKVMRLMRDHPDITDDAKVKKMIADGSWGKTVNFGEAWRDARAVPVDSWMGALTRPKGVFTKRSKHQLDELMEMTSDNPHLAGAAKALDKKLRTARAKVMSSPELYNSYKLLVGTAAKEMGWEPREVQETVWAAAMGMGLLRSAGLKGEDVVDKFTHEMARHSWDMEGVFDEKAFESELRNHGAPQSAIDAVAGWARRTTAPRRKTTGRVGLSPAERDAALRAAARIPAAVKGTVIGRTAYVPGEGGEGAVPIKHWAENTLDASPENVAKNRARRKREQKIRKWDAKKKADKKAEEAAAKALARARSRRLISRFGGGDQGDVPGGSAAAPMQSQSPPNDRRKHLSSEQVGAIIANQWHKRLMGVSGRKEEGRWAASTLYNLRKVPAWVLSPYRRVSDDDRSHTGGPIIVDRKKDGFSRHFGGLGQDIDVVVLDGKHRLHEHKREHGDAEIEAYVGVEADALIDRQVRLIGPIRERFIHALEEFYEYESGWDEVAAAGRELGLSDDDLGRLHSSPDRGLRYDPAFNLFVPHRNHQ